MTYGNIGDIPSKRAQFLAEARRLRDAGCDWVPALNAKIKEEADHAVCGEICPTADGSVYARVGLSNIDWTCSTTYNPPRVEMALRRFHMLVPLAAAWRDTGDECYAAAARQYIEAFLTDHPATDNWKPGPGDGATQYDLRIGCGANAGWMGTVPVFLSGKTFDDDFFAAMINAAEAHLRHLCDNVYPDRNIRSMQADVLLTNGLRLSFLPCSAAWRERGVRVLNDVLRRQVFPDGSHKEAVPGYHECVMADVIQAWTLARAYPELGLRVPTEKPAAMHDYAVYTRRPDGAITSMHDTRYSSSTGVFDNTARRARAEFRASAGLPDSPLETCRHFPDAGQVFLRDHWGADATYITFDVTPCRSFHWHPGRNSIQLFANGRALLVDAGYPFSNEDFPSYGTRTCHHSTINLNGWDQSHSGGKLRLRQAEGYDLIEGLYDGGYWPKEAYSHGAGMFAEHHRVLLWIRGRCIVVLDHVYNTSEPDRKPAVESVWQLSEGPARPAPDGRSAATGHAYGNLLMLFPLAPDGTVLSVHEGERSPMRGWVPIEWGQHYAPAPMLRLAAPCVDPWNIYFATVLVPFAGAIAPRIEARASEPDIGFSQRKAGRLDLRWEDGSQDAIVWTRRLEHAIDRQHGIDTDASLAHLRIDAAGNVAGGLAVDAEFLMYGNLNVWELVDNL